MAISTRRVISAVVCLLVLVLFLQTRNAQREPQHLFSTKGGTTLVFEDHLLENGRKPFFPGAIKPSGSNYSRVLVVPKLQSEHVGWIGDTLPGIKTAIYEVDNPSAGSFRVPKNKGHEAMVYLTYIIDHYDSLPDTIIFTHAHKTAWHNNVLLDLDISKAIGRLRDERVARQGYMNLRCHLDPGCPDWLHLDRPEVDLNNEMKPEEQEFSLDLFQKLFPGHRPPPVLSQPCCAQFAVSGERVRDNPKSLYEHLRNWLLSTKLDDTESGRVFEYLWQYLFTRNAEHCPAMNSCYCDGFGICFGSAAKLDAWLSKRKSREAIEAELDGAMKEKKDKATINEISARIWKLNAELSAEKAEAYARGDDELNRAIERERPLSQP